MAAGRGSRLGAHTDERPKALIDLGGITPLGLQIELLASRGVERVMIVTGYRRALVEAAARERAAGRLEIEPIWNPYWSVTNVVGSAWMARDRLTGPFVYLHADTVFTPSILDDLLASTSPAALPVDFRPCEPEQMKATVVDGLVTDLSKELPAEATAGEFIGIGVFGPAALDPIKRGLDIVLEVGATGRLLRGRDQRGDRRRAPCRGCSDRGQAVDGDRLRGRPGARPANPPRHPARDGGSGAVTLAQVRDLARRRPEHEFLLNRLYGAHISPYFTVVCLKLGLSARPGHRRGRSGRRARCRPAVPAP